ncbi:MAG: riboflavin synthase [Proteobacteria bacterium]|nr:riboflavin synthase [Pseudomonadota bacterium]
MFTGLITAVGRIAQVQALHAGSNSGSRVVVQAPPEWLQGVALGDSICISGACMTVVELRPPSFAFDVSTESLARTTGIDVPGALVNLEQSLTLATKLGGHLVTGHVDGIGRVEDFVPVGESWHLAVRVPAELAKFFAYKGSITVNGVSLTVNRVVDEAQGSAVVHVNLIPHTLQNTNLHTLQAGCTVNLEVDVIARYVQRMLGAQPGHEAQSL